MVPSQGSFFLWSCFLVKGLVAWLLWSSSLRSNESPGPLASFTPFFFTLRYLASSFRSLPQTLVFFFVRSVEYPHVVTPPQSWIPVIRSPRQTGRVPALLPQESFSSLKDFSLNLP